MSTSPTCRALLRLALSLPLLAGADRQARADEQIVLPFDCSVVGGKVRARPASDQAYRIYGTREQKRYRACSERNPERCRTFLVHRFTMACGPDRVSWPEFYAAVSAATDGRAHFGRDGLLYYRAGQRLGPRDPAGFGYPFPEPRRGGGLVQMPEGFAPLAGTEAIFTPLDPRVAALDNARPQAANGARHDRPSAATRSDPAGAPAPAPAVERPAPAEPEPAAKAAPAPALPAAPTQPPLETASTRKPAPPALSPGKATAPPETVPDVATGGTPVVPTILNNPAARHVEEATAAKQPETDTVVAAAEIVPPPAATAATGDGTSVKGWDMSSGGGSRLSLPPLVFAVAIAAATFAALLVILRRQAAAPSTAGPMRAAFEPVLPGLGVPEPGAHAAGQALVPRANPEPPTATGVLPPSHAMPATRAEALTLLGLSSDASDAVIRKVVEALRQSWHPDLGVDAKDRATRVERMKEINVAADILLRRPAA